MNHPWVIFDEPQHKWNLSHIFISLKLMLKTEFYLNHIIRLIKLSWISELWEIFQFAKRIPPWYFNKGNLNI